MRQEHGKKECEMPRATLNLSTSLQSKKHPSKPGLSQEKLQGHACIGQADYLHYIT
jgi:hypothetical protein